MSRYLRRRAWHSQWTHETEWADSKRTFLVGVIDNPPDALTEAELEKVREAEAKLAEYAMIVSDLAVMTNRDQ